MRTLLICMGAVLFSAALQGAFLKGPYVQNVTPTSMVVMWETDSNDTSVVQYGLTAAYGLQATGPAGVTVHEVNVTGLSSDTAYHYRVNTGTHISTDAVFKAAPAKGTAGKTFYAYGDSRTNEWTHGEVAEAMLETGLSTFILSSGDIVPSSTSDAATWGEDFFNSAAALFAGVPVFVGRGNHESTNPLYTVYLSHPSGGSGSEYYYSFDYGNVHCIALDTESTYTAGSPQYTWLEGDLTAASGDALIDWIVVYFHTPPYSTGSVHGSDTGIRNAWSPLFETYGVDIVFNGDDHTYERVAQQNGVVYVVTGGGGADLYTQGTPQAWSVLFMSVNNYCTITADNDKLTLKAHAVRGTDSGYKDGEIFDATVIYASGSWSPTAKAGPDQMVNTGQLVTLNGSASYDGEGDTFSYAWSQADGPAVTLSNPAAAQPTFTPSAAGIYGFELVCTEGGTVASYPDQVRILVKDAALGGQTTINPVADTWVDELTPTAGYGTVSPLNVDGGDGSRQLAYLKFNIPAVQGDILKAVLRCYVSNNSDFGGYIRSFTNTAWSETGITWNAPLSVDGPIVGGFGLADTDTWVEADVTPAITGSGLVSLAILPSSDNGADYVSREGANPPQLIIHFSGVSVLPLTASITAPAADPHTVTTGNGSTVNFTALAGGGTGPYTYEWDYEYSGAFSADASGSTGSHVYNNGEYQAALRISDSVPDTVLDTVTIRVFDNGGTASDYTDDSDFDADGLPDGWELYYFNDFDETAAGDPDNDGIDNAAEYAAGTDPAHTATVSQGSKGGCAAVSGGLGVLILLIGSSVVLLAGRRRT